MSDKKNRILAHELLTLASLELDKGTKFEDGFDCVMVEDNGAQTGWSVETEELLTEAAARLERMDLDMALAKRKATGVTFDLFIDLLRAALRIQDIYKMHTLLSTSLARFEAIQEKAKGVVEAAESNVIELRPDKHTLQ